MSTPPELDPDLWFTMPGHCEGRHYVLGNAHTFPGRALGWCASRERSFFFNAAQVDEASPAARAWLDGFLWGSQPPPPRGADGDVDFGSPAYTRWEEQTREFRRTGIWEEPSEAGEG